ncbi:PREDICTED: maestro heat-like repeat family member 5 [Hipposideros armiger]|uniref:Maestro heat-like repeat family member 5 n=1 Tax=Hipposideros armiger TaxID=186990 RepID=A0A8B7SKZ1_HIPAR|nr:PREDICTED: maestro heat-like repeat family member 5 [Hipposideros armiger]
MDGQHLETPRSHTTADRASSAMSQNPRISSHTSESMKDLSCRKVPQNSAHRDRPAHPTTTLLSKSHISQAALGPQEHSVFLKEASNAAICFKMLRDLNGVDPYHLKYIINKIKDMAHEAPDLVLEAIHHYFIDNPEISNQHKLQLLHTLETVIGASDSLEERWREIFMKLALENMTKSTELEEVYQNAASNVLVAICRHSWQTVTQHLETEVLTGVFPHRSLLYVMGTLTSNQKLFSEGEKACWEEQLTQIAVKSVQFLNTDMWSKELLWALTKPDRTHYEQPPEKAFLFVYYGLILQAEENSAMVRTHLQSLLETSHQWSKQREGIALTVGLAAARHLDHVWAILEQFGQSAPIKRSLHSFSPKTSKDLRWKWATSTILLAYGQMAAKAKAHILPWVDNVLSRMIFYFHCSSWDETLKQSFLTAILMLVGAVSRSEGAHSYEFSQLSQLFECLMALMEKEPPDSLCSSTREQTIHIISSLCKLRPALDSEKKSRLLSICLHSVLALPLLDVLEKHACLFLEPPNVQGLRPPDRFLVPTQTLYSKTSEALDKMLQTFITQNPTADELQFLLSHMYIWLASEKAHERRRAAHACTALLKFLTHNHYLDPKEDFKQIGQLMGVLGILCQDPDRATQLSSLQGLGHLYQLLLRHRAEALRVEALVPEPLFQASEDEDPLWSSGDQKDTLPTPQKVAFPKDRIFQLGSSQVIKEVMKHLTVAELTDVTWTAIDGLDSSSTFHVQAAANMVLTVVQEHGAKLETVANLGRAIHLQLRCGRVPQAQEKALRAITLLARNHTAELVATFLDVSVPLNSRAFQLWRALGAEQRVSRRVLVVLLALLQERPLPIGADDSSPQPKEKTYLRSLAAMNILHELQLTREFEKAMQEAYPQLLLAFLAQIHYMLELSLPTGPQRDQQAPEAATPSPQSAIGQGVTLSCMEAGNPLFLGIPVPGYSGRRLSKEQEAAGNGFISAGPAHVAGCPCVAEREPITQQGHPPGHRKPLEADGLLVPMPISLDTAPLLPRRMSLEALKSLLTSMGHWQDLAHLELQGAWELFSTIHTYPQGVSLLARAMVQNRCQQIQEVLIQLLPTLQSQEERERKVAILMLTEFLYSPALLEVLSKQDTLNVLTRSLRDPSPEVRVLSLQGLRSVLFHPDQGSLLRGQLPRLLNGFFQKNEPVVELIMGTVSDVLHRLGACGVGVQCLSVAINARSFFDDERDRIRAAAMALFGDLVATMAGKEPSSLRTQVYQSMVPLLLHLKDRCPAVITQAKFAFYRCAVLLHWPLQHTLFCSLAWERSISARHFLWTCLMTHSQEKFSIHLAQALSHLHSPHHHIRTWAALFIGYTICYHPQAVSQMLNDADRKLLLCTFEDLKKDPEPGLREFATKQFCFLQQVAARPQ